MDIHKVLIILVLFSAPLYARPVIDWVTVNPKPRLNEPFNLTTYVYDDSPNYSIDKVFVNFSYPLNNTFEMSSIYNYKFNETNYSTVYNLPFATNSSHSHIFKIMANNTAGEITSSNYLTFRSIIDVNATINVKVAATCCGSYSQWYFPSEVLLNDTVATFAFFYNCGNLLQEELTSLTITNSSGDRVGSFMGGNKKGFIIESKPQQVAPLNDVFFWAVWYSEGLPIGNYTARLFTNYSATYGEKYNLTFNWTDLNNSYNCELKNNTGTCSNITFGSCAKDLSDVVYSVDTDQPAINFSTENITEATFPANATAYNAYKKRTTLQGANYTAYTFNTTNCEDYCYACLSKDNTLTDEEGGFDGGFVGTPQYYINDIDPLGQFLELIPYSEYCFSKETYFECNVTENKAVCDKYSRCIGFVEREREFEILKSLGDVSGRKQPELVIIREMPSFIKQKETCEPNNPWSTCNILDVKLVLFNRGNQTAFVEDVYDTIDKTCSSCNIIDIRCGDGAFNCTIPDSNRSLIKFLPNQPIIPNDYEIMHYQIVIESSKYTNNINSETGYFDFFANASYTGVLSNSSKISEEKDKNYNPTGSRKIYLVNQSVFNYDLDINLSTSVEERDFKINKNTTLYLTAKSLGQKDDWFYKIMLPHSWKIHSCKYETGVTCSCSFNNNQSYVACNSTQIIDYMGQSRISFKVETPVIGDYLVPISAKNQINEEYMPGLFTLAKQKQEAKYPMPEPKPEPDPEPQPDPEPEPEPEPEEGEGEIQIDLKPIKPKVKGHQLQYTPVLFNITNIGTEPVYNITIEPILPLGWNYTTGLVSFLNVSKTLNRTLFLNPSLDITPSTYALPFKAVVENKTLDIAYWWFKVLQARNYTKLEIIESPRSVSLVSNKNESLAILLKNKGKSMLSEVKMRIENVENCIKRQNSEIGIIKANNTKSLSIELETKTGPATCPGFLIVESKQGANAFAPLQIKVRTPTAFIIPSSINLLLAGLITVILLALLRIRKKQAMLKLKTIDEVIVLLLLIDLILVFYFVLSGLGML